MRMFITLMKMFIIHMTGIVLLNYTNEYVYYICQNCLVHRWKCFFHMIVKMFVTENEKFF